MVKKVAIIIIGELRSLKLDIVKKSLINAFQDIQPFYFFHVSQKSTTREWHKNDGIKTFTKNLSNEDVQKIKYKFNPVYFELCDSNNIDVSDTFNPKMNDYIKALYKRIAICFKKVEEFEDKTKLKFDYVFITRPDLIYLKKPIFNDNAVIFNWDIYFNVPRKFAKTIANVYYTFTTEGIKSYYSILQNKEKKYHSHTIKYLCIAKNIPVQEYNISTIYRKEE